jgi:hypothetical protein
MSRSVIYLNRRGRKFSRSRARQWWRTSDPMVVSAGADLVSIGVDVVSIGVVSIGDDVLSIGDDVIHPTGNIMRANIDSRDGGSVGSVAIGKAAIVWEILQAEQSSKLFNAQNPDMIPEIKYDDTWLSYFLSMLVSSLKREQATNLLRNVTIINFNYDRTIEHFLFNRLQTNLGLDREEAGQALGALTANMIRPYGSVGPLPWQQDQGAVPYGFFLSRDHERLFALSENIRTYTEQNVSGSLRSGIGTALQNARLVAFLGFGFHQQNMALLQATGSHEPWRRVIGTVQGVDSENWELMKISISHATKCQSPTLVQLLDRSAHVLLSSMRPSLMV